MVVILFDLEGTLVQSLEADERAVVESRIKTKEKLIELGIPRSELEDITRSTLMRKKAVEYVEQRFSPNEAKQFHIDLDKFLKNYELLWAEGSKIFRDTLPTLRVLRSLGYRIGLVTNTSTEAANRMLSIHSIADFFEVVITRENVKQIKPDPEGTILALKRLKTQDFFFVGDLVYDSEAAKTAGGKVIIINRNPSRNVEFYADHVVNALTEVPEIIEQTVRKHK